MNKVSLLDFFGMDMNGKLVVSLHLPQRESNYQFRSFKVSFEKNYKNFYSFNVFIFFFIPKITRRFQNAHAYVNAAFLMKVENGKVLEKPRIVYGGISPEFVRTFLNFELYTIIINVFYVKVHASKTEAILEGSDITKPEALKKAVETLGAEINPDTKPLEGAPEYRKGLAQSLLYKVLLA